ncbi:MAG: glycoside hydrolase family 127 protein [Firmicutes bacterium]|nr:glycoside hydrolase family 127 protein [Bacillota bacterium]
MYEQFDPLKNAELALNYLTNMVDEKYDNLPYWLILPHKKPAEAAHCRVDDAELVGSWYQAINHVRKMLNTDVGAEVEQSFRRHLLKSWGEHGLRFHEDYSWTHTNHSSFHEMGYILPALNQILEENPDDTDVERIAARLIRGMRSLVTERKVRTFWSGDFVEEQPVYEFPNDVYLRDKGFDLTRHTGRGEQAIRNSIMLHSLVRRYEYANDEAALDLAVGMANYLLGPSRYFNYKMEFFGHVHSNGWVASGLVYLGRVTGNKAYLESGKKIYDYIRSISSDFGWVPEYAQWHPVEEEHCETCCIKDMIECAYELTLVGYDEYWNDINNFARNQLVENQVKNTDYVVSDNSLPDKNGITYKDIGKRMIGGFSGGSTPTSISLTKFRSIAGCCVGMAPVALAIVWNNAVLFENNAVVVNIPLNKSISEASVVMEYPNEGKLSVAVYIRCDVKIRKYPFMHDVRAVINGIAADFSIDGENLMVFKDVPADAVVTITHTLETVKVKETVRGAELTVIWRGCDVVDILPHGEHMRLYQRDLSVPRYYPNPEDIVYSGASDYAPTQQKK